MTRFLKGAFVVAALGLLLSGEAYATEAKYKETTVATIGTQFRFHPNINFALEHSYTHGQTVIGRISLGGESSDGIKTTQNEMAVGGRQYFTFSGGPASVMGPCTYLEFMGEMEFLSFMSEEYPSEIVYITTVGVVGGVGARISFNDSIVVDLGLTAHAPLVAYFDYQGYRWSEPYPKPATSASLSVGFRM